MPGISDVQKLIKQIDLEIEEKESEIGILNLTRKRLIDSEKDRKRRSNQKKYDKESQQS